jgi:uncharacterized membrane protein YphA (DoxX/SURF4 family)
MIQKPAGAWQQRLLAGVCLVLAVEFILGGAAKFYPGDTFFGPSYAVKFVGWGYPAWFRFVVGAGELVAAMLLALPRTRFHGAAILVVILTGAVITHIVNPDPLTQGISADVHLPIVAAVAWVTRSSALPRRGATVQS